MYEICAAFLAALAIFSMCASTTEYFQIALPQEVPDNSSTNGAWMSIKHNLSFNNELNRRPLKGIHYQVSPVIYVVDCICLGFFTLEYLILLLSASNQWKFVRSTTSIIDILAIVPDYVEIMLHIYNPNPKTDVHVSAIMLLSLMRINRIFRLVFRVPALNVMRYSLRASSHELSLMILFTMLGTVMFGSVMYHIEDKRIFTSIPKSFWWAIIMITTVGYGDMIPLTPLGQLLGSITAICGIILIAFNMPSLVTNYMNYSVLIEYLAHRKYIRKMKMSGISAEDIDKRCSRLLIHKSLEYV